jgi:hypothetical protein
MGFKGTAYVGQCKEKFGGLYHETKQPSGFGKSSKTTSSNMGESSHDSKGSMFGKKWKPTCKSCGGKM